MKQHGGANSQVRIAIDGFDGSGKTTLAHGIEQACASSKISCQVIGRKANNSSAPIGALTDLILQSDGRLRPLTPSADAHIRLARLHERIALADNSVAQVVIFDRWIPSDLSRISDATKTTHEADFELASELANIDVLMMLRTSFDTAWNRIEARSNSMSPGERLGRTHNESLFERLELMFRLEWMTKVLQIESTESEAATLSSAWIQIEMLREGKGLR
ncbi:hypothetical protein ITJ38_03360 [Agreia pratensis]|uniref:hypothetical protein n=1 Tax=Agreia pratensis TaxID=150121 RepID=UPI00188CD07C|nr:hypothetical protein [Agreia pratensis]MBF4633436.1 hypothetical protein [Agreia pratensis]